MIIRENQFRGTQHKLRSQREKKITSIKLYHESILRNMLHNSKPKLGGKCIHFGTELELEPAHPPFRLSLTFQPSQFCSPFVVRGMSHLQLSPNENTQFLYHWLGTAGTGDPDFAIAHTPKTLPIPLSEWGWPPPRAGTTPNNRHAEREPHWDLTGEQLPRPAQATKPQTQALPRDYP